MKSIEDVKLYKRMYYLSNRKKLCEYSKNYYTYQKAKGDLSNEEISEQMKKFLKTYKKHSKKELKNFGLCKICKEPITISFN